MLTPALGINITVDYTLDELNENWFNPVSTVGQARRAAVDSAAAFLSEIIINDDWEPLPVLNESFSLSDIASNMLFNLDGSPLIGTPESDGEGYTYSSSSNNIDTTNRSSVAANEYVVYVAAFAFDSGATANAKAGWDSYDRRNDAGDAGVEFNTWGGRVWFNSNKDWYTDSNPGTDPTDDYGFQDPDKSPSTDSTSDNWDWSTSSQTWKGFDLLSIDPAANDKRDLYATAVHELMHALGATSSVIEDYVGLDGSGDFIGENLVATYGGPVPGDGGHFAVDTQSIVWGSEDIHSETVLDPNSRVHTRKYFTDLDAALLRDIGYQVLEDFPSDMLTGDFNGDGMVDAADYAVWRNGYGAEYYQEDYSDWRSNYGASLSSISFNTQASAPEPGSLLLALMCFSIRTRQRLR